MKKFNLKKGFTLIELLVVIAIIGILASVVLASLNNARAKGSDAAIKANLSGIRANAELQFDTLGGCYADAGVACGSGTPAAYPASGDSVCPDSGSGDSIFALPSIAQQIAAAEAAGGIASCTSTSSGGAWAVAVRLKSDPDAAWCVDSTGQSKQVANSVTDAYTQATLDDETAGGVCASS